APDTLPRNFTNILLLQRFASMLPVQFGVEKNVCCLDLLRYVSKSLAVLRFMK
ncbi:hypothetical protein L9F63_009149, partial [Diploptera punctata]